MDDAVLHLQRYTLLEKALHDSPISAKKTTLSRMMYAARTINKEDNKERLTEYHVQLLKDAAGPKELVSGFLLIYPTCCLHLVEAQTAFLIKILKLLSDDTQMIDTVSIFSFTEEVPSRIFAGWMSGFIISANLGPYDPHPKNVLASAMSSFNINMLKWGRQLSEMVKDQQTLALESIRTYAEELLPDDAGVLYGILLCEDVPRLQDVLDMFDSRLKPTPAVSDIVWPKPRPIYIPKKYRDPTIARREAHNKASLAASRASLAAALKIFGNMN